MTLTPPPSSPVTSSGTPSGTPPAPRMLVAQGLRLRLWDHGGTAAPVVLFLHGYLDTGRSFDEAARSLAADAHVLALDFRGHGESDRVGAGGSYHLLDHVKDLAIVLAALATAGTPIAALAAHSMGGNIALLLAGAVPALVPRLVLLDACGAPPEDPSDVPARLAELVQSVLVDKKPFSPVESIAAAVERLRALNGGLSEQGALRMVRDVLVPTPDGKLAFPFDPALRGPSPVRWPEATWRSLAANLTMPVRLLRAADGYVADGEPTRGRMAAMAHATMRTIPGGHHVHVEAPDEVAATVREVLRLPV